MMYCLNFSQPFDQKSTICVVTGLKCHSVIENYIVYNSNNQVDYNNGLMLFMYFVGSVKVENIEDQRY